MPSGSTVEYLVDGQHRRIGKRLQGQLVQGFLWGGPLSPVAELDGAGQVVSRFVYATRANVPDYLVRGGATYRLLTDHLGSVRLVVDVATGEVAQRLDYDSFGRIQLDTNPGFQPFSFAGGLYDHQTGLLHFGARDYDPQLGRWLTPEPLLFGAGDTNLYTYAHNDPVNYYDADGRIPLPLFTGLVGGAVGIIGNGLGQIFRNDGFDCFNWKELAIAGGVGFAAGLAAPIVATQTAGSVLLGLGANLVQYGATQAVNGDDLTWKGAGIAAGTGLFGGWLGGSIARASGITFNTSSTWLSKSAAQAVNDSYDVGLNAGASNFIRSTAGATAANLDPTFAESPCECD